MGLEEDNRVGDETRGIFICHPEVSINVFFLTCWAFWDIIYSPLHCVEVLQILKITENVLHSYNFFTPAISSLLVQNLF